MDTAAASTAEVTPSLPVTTMWIGFGIPFRPSSGTYDVCDVKLLPPVHPSLVAEFADIKTLEDVVPRKEWIEEQLRSCTSCYVAVNSDDKSFYRDQQDCVVWCFTPSRGVYLLEEESEHKDDDSVEVVASTLAEFFARLKLENSVWRKMSTFKKHPDHLASLQGFRGMFKMKDPKDLWEAFKPELSPVERDYVEAYAKA